MGIRAYDESYLDLAQDVLGHAVDFAVMTLGLEPDEFGKAFSVSDVSRQFASGNPRYVAGMNGCEVARQVLLETRMAFDDADDAMFLDKSPEYWAGWALAYYQWHSSCEFMDILAPAPLSRIIEMYPTYHEMDVCQFSDRMDEIMRAAYPTTRLKVRRTNMGLTQRELALESGVALRQIQLFEQRQRDINSAAAITLLKLGKVLHCRMEDLIEPDFQQVALH